MYRLTVLTVIAGNYVVILPCLSVCLNCSIVKTILHVVQL